MTIESTRRSGGEGRFLFVDGLRGVAAMMVVFYHFENNLRDSLSAWLPEFLSILLRNGNVGVDMFFVLSGFVIAHSIRKGDHSFTYLWRFGLRRSIRLDPPLWATIVLELALLRLSLFFFSGLDSSFPGLGKLIANVTYTQHLLQLGDIVPVFWSLTYEVQFYMVLVVAACLLRNLYPIKENVGRPKAVTTMVIFLGVFVYSLEIYQQAVPNPLFGLFLDRWFQFALGMAAWLAFRGVVPVGTFLALCGAATIAIVTQESTTYRNLSSLVAVMTAMALFYAGWAGKMGSLLAGPSVQFLGKISYSLYLIHLPVGWRFMSLGKELFGPTVSPMLGVLLFMASVLVSILAAWLMFMALEAPSISLARKIRLPKRAA